MGQAAQPQPDDGELDSILAAVEKLLDGYELPAAESLLARLFPGSGILAVAPPEKRCRAFLEWGWIHGATQRYETARWALSRAVTIAEPLRPRLLLCEALRESAVVAKYESDYQAAVTALKRCELVARQESYHLELGRALLLQATIAHHRVAFADARDLLIQAAAAAAECPPDAGTELLRADICRERAVSARIAGDFDAARSFLMEARDGYSRLGRRVGVANAERELGAVLAAIPDYSGARGHYGAAFAAYLRTGRRMGAAQVARRIGILDMLEGTEDSTLLPAAARRFAQALRLGSGDLGNAARTTFSQGQLAHVEGNLDASERLLDETVRLYSAMTDTGDIARGLSEVALEYGRIAQDRDDQAAATALFREALAPLDETEDPGPASLAHYHLAFELIKAGEVVEALHHAVASFQLNEAHGRRLQDPAERHSFYRERRRTYILAMHCAARADDGRAALTVATAARSEALAAFVRAGARLAPDLYGLVDQITLVTAQAALSSGQDDSTADRLGELYARLEHLTSRQMRQAMTARETEPDEIIATLPAGGHALLLDVLEDDGTIGNRVWVSHTGEIRVDEVIFPAPVRRFLDSYDRAGDEVAWQPQHDELAELGQAVLPPGLAELLASGANPPLVVSTGSLLAPVPAAALRVNGRYLAEQAQLALVPSIALWVALRSRAPQTGRGTLAFYDPELPSSRREEAALRSALPPVELTGPGQLRTVLAEATRYAAVVIGAHGSLPGAGADPAGGPDRQAGLAQALTLDGTDLLTAGELLTCRLPDAFIMPSCWSGRLTVRTAIEPFGLPTAALAAGARWVLAGTVNIGDSTTASLMRAFYRGLGAGLVPAAALQRAQAGFLRSRPRTAPGTWAGLTVVGDGFTPLSTSRRQAGSPPESQSSAGPSASASPGRSS